MVGHGGAPTRPSSVFLEARPPQLVDDLGPVRDRLRDRRRVELDVAVVLAAREGEVSRAGARLREHEARHARRPAALSSRGRSDLRERPEAGAAATSVRRDLV